MANKVQEYIHLSEQATRQISGSYKEWTGFLATAARLYKYPFNEQLLIYAQRPEATACADYDLWNKQMRRYVMRGAKGIALIDTSTGKNRIRYVFDVADTGEKENARRPWLWQYRPEHQQVVTAALEKRFGISGKDGLADQLEQIASVLAGDYWKEHEHELIRIVDGSFLESYDSVNIGVQFWQAATVSTTYVLMARCGLEPETHFQHEDFLSVFDFNTLDTVTELGTAISQSSEQVLREIEVAIKEYEREKHAERSNEHGTGTDLQTGGRRSPTRTDPPGTAEPELGQIRLAAPEISEREPSGDVQPAGTAGDLVQPPAGGGGQGQRDAGEHDARTGENGGGNGGPESPEHDGVGRTDELLQGPGGGDHSGGTDLQLNTEDDPEGPSVETPGPSAVSNREITQDDIDTALREWNGDPDSKRRVRQYMTEHGREKDTADWLRSEYGDDLPAFPVTVEGAAIDLPWPKVQRYLARLVKDNRFFTEEAAPEKAPTVREIFEQYKPVITNLVLADTAYQNACRNSDRETAVIEGDAAVKRAALTITEPEFMRLYYDMPDFRYRLHREVIDETYAELSVPSPEYDEETPPWGVETGDHSPWGKVQESKELAEGIYQISTPSHGGIMVRETDANNLLSPETVAAGGSENGWCYFEEDAVAPVVIRELRDKGVLEPEVKPPDLSSQPVIREGDTITIGAGDTTHEVEITVSDEQWQEIQAAIPDTAAPPARDPLAPAYDVGDKVCLDGTEYVIEDISLFDVQLRDPTQAYPVLRSEPKDRFIAVLLRDSRNSHITDFLAADLSQFNEDFREVLTSGLLTDEDRNEIIEYFRAGKGNREMGGLLSGLLGNRVDTTELSTGETADYFTSGLSMRIEILNDDEVKIASAAYSWHQIAPVLRSLWQQELDGFTHAPVQRDPVRLEGKPSYQVGDKVSFQYGDHEVTGTIGYIGDLDVRIDTGPYAWNNQVISRDFFEDAIRQDERNAHLFTQEPEPPPAPEVTPETTTIYPGDKNGLPFDVIVQRLPVDEPEQTQPEQIGAQNFRITDDHLGEGGPKAKFRMNMDAINTLQGIELEGRSATRSEQEVLSRYVGWGGLPDAFDPDKPEWANEYLELKAALTPAEYEAARTSVLNSHYTSPVVIKAIYEAVGNMGFTAGNILEPSCGVGNFFGLLPEAMAASKLYGVELDSITGRIAQQLYPKANITVAGFETTDRRDFYDLAVGNVPFGDYPVSDRAYNKYHFSIHNYFAAKMLDQVRPGGIAAFVTSRYTMDAKSEDTRKYLAERADLLGAIRLPNNAFRANAGTDVVTDILFFQKRDTPQVELPDWVHVGKNENGFTVNRYFISHPEMILGRQSGKSTQYAGQEFTVEPIEGLELSDQLRDAVKYIRGQYREAEPSELEEGAEQERVTIPADPNVQNFSFAVVDGDVYFRENSIMEKQHLNGAAKDRVVGMVELRDCVRELIDLQTKEDVPDSAVREQQGKLNQLYDAFAAEFGLINDRRNQQVFSSDDSYYLLCALEIIDEDGRLERKADMFTKRTISPHQAVDHVDTASEALAVSIAEKAKVDMPYMAQLSGKTEEQLEQELSGVIFRDIRCAEDPYRIPRSFVDLNQFPFVTADEYLSGNVRRKLRMAQALAEVLPPKDAAKIRQNVEALTAAQPQDLDASEIEVRLGATWVDKKYIQQFMYETLDTPWRLQGGIKVNYSPVTAEWQITGKRAVYDHDIAAYTTFGTRRANAYEILQDTLNLRDIRIYDYETDLDGNERRVLNSKETTLAQQKQQALKDAFRDWIWKDARRRQALVKQYNEEMNSIRPREYDGSHIVFSGMNSEIQLQPHQVNAVAHVLYGGNTLLAHEVGAGKTFEMIAAAMESKRLGLCRKSIFVVPNHLIQQWASEFMRLYPSANILVTTKKDFQPARRKKFCARIATGDYDAVIIGQSQFEKIPVSFERQERIIQDEIREIMIGIQRLKYQGGENFSIKQMVKAQRRLEKRLADLSARYKKDSVVTFEQLGVDRMFVDESDFYKNLFLTTKMRNVAGLSTTDAQKSSDMFAKCRYLDEITGGRGVIFATGTPISNSMTEMFTIHRYLQYDRLQEMGMGHFDCWASRFGETSTVLELAPEGTGYRPRTRFAKFFNLPELMNFFKEVADVKTADQLHLPTPEVEYHTIASKPTEHQKTMVQELSERASKVHGGTVDPRVDNMLKITSDGRKLGLDQRIIDPLLPDEPGTKVNRCVENILHIWQEGEAGKLTQIVFCDISTPQAKPSKKKKGLAQDTEKPFTIYDDIKQKLIAAGMPPEQIAFIHDADTDQKKKALFSKVNAGQVRVIIGSTAKMGAGTNIQKRLIALHDLDCPWRPRDLIQRKGRIERRGNDNKKVHVFRYVTEGTFDAYLWQTIENKQKFISQIMTSKSPVRSCEDVDETALSYAEIKALCAGDPRIKERMDLDIDVSRLRLLKADHQSQQYRLEDNLLKYFPEQIKQDQEFITGFKADMETLAAHPHPIITVENSPAKTADGEQPAADTLEAPSAVEVKQGFAGMEIGGVTFADRAEAGKALLAACKELKAGEAKEIGSYRGFAMSISPARFFEQTSMTLKGKMTHLVELSDDVYGNITRMDNTLEKMPERLQGMEAHLQTLYQQQSAAKAELGKPFPKEEELRVKSARLAELDSALNIDHGAPPAEQSIAKSERPSVLEGLKRPLPPRQKPDKPKNDRQER